MSCYSSIWIIFTSPNEYLLNRGLGLVVKAQTSPPPKKNWLNLWSRPQIWKWFVLKPIFQIFPGGAWTDGTWPIIPWSYWHWNAWNAQAFLLNINGWPPPLTSRFQTILTTHACCHPLGRNFYCRNTSNLKQSHFIDTHLSWLICLLFTALPQVLT